MIYQKKNYDINFNTSYIGKYFGKGLRLGYLLKGFSEALLYFFVTVNI